MRGASEGARAAEVNERHGADLPLAVAVHPRISQKRRASPKGMPAALPVAAAEAAAWDALVSFELVLHVFANFLGVSNNLVLLTLCAQTVIVRGVAGRFLGLAAEVLCFVLNFVADTHGVFHLSLPVKKLSGFTITQSMLTNSRNKSMS
jgi:hypothetical protein